MCATPSPRRVNYRELFVGGGNTTTEYRIQRIEMANWTAVLVVWALCSSVATCSLLHVKDGGYHQLTIGFGHNVPPPDNCSRFLDNLEVRFRFHFFRFFQRKHTHTHTHMESTAEISFRIDPDSNQFGLKQRKRNPFFAHF